MATTVASRIVAAGETAGITRIHAAADNARAEGINNKIRLLSHRAYGFHSAAPLIATVYLCCGGIHLPQQLHLL